MSSILVGATLMLIILLIISIFYFMGKAIGKINVILRDLK